jgi:hypothetical protein
VEDAGESPERGRQRSVPIQRANGGASFHFPESSWGRRRGWQEIRYGVVLVVAQVNVAHQAGLGKSEWQNRGVLPMFHSKA